MNKKSEIGILVIGVIAVVLAFVYLDISNSIFGKIFDSFTPVNFDEVQNREIVRNAIPIILLEEDGDSCLVFVEKFHLLIDQDLPFRNEQLAKELNYDRENKTLVVPCDELYGEKSKLHVWYVIEEAPRHATKYEYFITEWEETKKGEELSAELMK